MLRLSEFRIYKMLMYTKFECLCHAILWQAHMLASVVRHLSFLICKKYFTIERMIEKYIGKRPVLDRSAKLEEYLFNPKMYFKYLVCDFSAILLFYMFSYENVLSVLQAALFVLKHSHISDPYTTMDLIIRSYK